MTSQRETVLCTYHYDPLDRLTSHALPDIGEHQRFYCKSRLATEIQGVTRYSIVQYGDQLLAQQRSGDDAPDTTLLATDQHRSVLQMLKVDHQRQPVAYTPYGHRSIKSGLLGFNGERADRVTGCYLLGNGRRAFNPVLLRFNSPDSVSPFGKGGLNAYAYCLGDPINLHDPSGNVAVPKFITGLFDRLRGAVGRKKSRSGSGVTYADVTTYTHSEVNMINEVRLDGSFIERTRTFKNGAFKQTRFVKGTDKDITRSDERGVWITSKRSPTLQELAYSKLTPENMRELPTLLPHRIDIDVDRFNMYNASSELTHTLMSQGIRRGDASVQSGPLIMEKATRGTLMGVHPVKAQLIRKTDSYFS
jgi:RHS repeat-associated protein